MSIIREINKRKIMKQVDDLEDYLDQNIKVILGFQSGIIKMLSSIDEKLSVIEFKEHNNSSSLQEIKECKKMIKEVIEKQKEIIS